MIKIEFKGWFQCRLATDPDHWTEKRGKNGWTFAYGNEPDLDRVIRFQSPIAPRSHCPSVSVNVTGVIRDGASIANHPLVGTPVDLAGGPVFEGRNGQIADSAKEPIVPFLIKFGTPAASVSGSDPIDLSIGNEITRRGPIGLETQSAEAASATGVNDYAAYRAARKTKLEQQLPSTVDPAEREIIQRRIHRLTVGNTIERNSLGFRCPYRFELRGSNQWNDPNGVFGTAPQQGAIWTADFWFGAWDADALSGFAKGALIIS